MLWDNRDRTIPEVRIPIQRGEFLPLDVDVELVDLGSEEMQLCVQFPLVEVQVPRLRTAVGTVAPTVVAAFQGVLHLEGETAMPRLSIGVRLGPPGGIQKGL
ncbi:hypothetical protein C7G41_33050 [Bradyrhizobium sp. MOS002]|nr:hypothetical protein C7G41_33050 [Bradyrhizobium sp. MOS002]